MLFKIWVYTGVVGGKGLMKVYLRKYIFEFSRDNFEQFNVGRTKSKDVTISSEYIAPYIT